MRPWGWMFAEAALVLGLAGGCAHQPPSELLAAREAYRRASTGPAAQVVPAELHKARLALSQADASFAASPGGQRTRDLAYVAERRAERAEALAAAAQARVAERGAEREQQRQVQAEARTAERELATTRAELAESERERAQAVEERERARQALAAAEEREEGEAARRSLEAMTRAQDTLRRVGMVREEDRGTVVTLAASTLFNPEQATLLPEAKGRLDQVAAALLALPSDRRLLIEGYSDASGSADRNLELSRQRATTIGDYLIHRGVPAERVQIVAYGRERPLADNSTAEGRALNRRVEIVVQQKGRSYSQRAGSGAP